VARLPGLRHHLSAWLARSGGIASAGWHSGAQPAGRTLRPQALSAPSSLFRGDTMSRRRRLMSAISLLVTACFAAEAGAATCFTVRERQAHEVYAIRTEALVGAQSCRMTDRFNAFATRHRQELLNEGHALKAYYQRVYGRGGDKALDDYVTYLANASATAQPQNMGFCAAAEMLFEKLMLLPVGQLAKFSRDNPAPALPAMQDCGARTHTATIKQ